MHLIISVNSASKQSQTFTEKMSLICSLVIINEAQKSEHTSNTNSSYLLMFLLQKFYTIKIWYHIRYTLYIHTCICMYIHTHTCTNTRAIVYIHIHNVYIIISDTCSCFLSINEVITSSQYSLCSRPRT